MQPSRGNLVLFGLFRALSVAHLLTLHLFHLKPPFRSLPLALLVILFIELTRLEANQAPLSQTSFLFDTLLSRLP